MAGFSPYDKVEWAEYTPLSSQEILSPAMMMRERHDALDAEIGETNNQLQKIAAIAKNDPNPLVREQFEAFENEVINSRDTLMNEGYTPQAKRNLLDLRSRYTAEIAPYEMAHELKRQDLLTQQQKKMQDDSYIGEDINSRSIVDYVENGLQPMSSRGVSGNQIANMVRETLAPYSREENIDKHKVTQAIMTLQGVSKEEAKVIMEDYYKLFSQKGLKPGDRGHAALLKLAGDHVKNVLGLSGADWVEGNETIERSINSAIELGGTATFGGSDISYLGKKGLSSGNENNDWGDYPSLPTVLVDNQGESWESSLKEGDILYNDPENPDDISTDYIINSKEELEKRADELSEIKSILGLEENEEISKSTIGKEIRSINNRIIERDRESADIYRKFGKIHIDIKVPKEVREERKRQKEEKLLEIKRNNEENKKDYEKINSLENLTNNQKELITLSKDLSSYEKKLKEKANKWHYLGNTQAEKIQNGEALEKAQSIRENRIITLPLGEGHEITQEILSAVETGLLNKKKSELPNAKIRLVKVDSDFSPKNKKKKNNYASAVKVREMIDSKKASTVLTKDGIHIKHGNDIYFIEKGTDVTDNVNLAMQSVATDVRDFTKEPTNITKVEGNNIKNAQKIVEEVYTNGDIIHSTGNYFVKRGNFIDPNGEYFKIYVIATLDENNSPVFKTFKTSYTDELFHKGEQDELMKEISHISFYGLLSGSKRTTTKPFILK